MTFIETISTDDTLRAVLTEEYLDLRSLTPHFLDCLITIALSNSSFALKSIDIAEKQESKNVDLGYTSIQMANDGTAYSLNIEKMLTEQILPSAIITEEMLGKMGTVGVQIDVPEIVDNCSMYIDFDVPFDADDGYEYNSDPGEMFPPMIMISIENCDGEADSDTLAQVVGFFQNLLTQAFAVQALDKRDKKQKQDLENTK